MSGVRPSMGATDMSRWTEDPGSDPEYCDGLAPDMEPDDLELEPLAVECVWCTPRHLITPGRLPASSSLCATALAAEHAKLDAAAAAKREARA